MSKYHINDSNELKRCRAKKRCKFMQYPSKESANKAIVATKELLTGKEFETLSGISGVGTFQNITINGETVKIHESIDNKRTRFLLANGLCGDLAVTITKIDPNYRLYALIDKETDPQSLTKENFWQNAAHVIAGNPQEKDTFIDSYGKTSAQDLLDFYGDYYKIVEISKISTVLTGGSGKNIGALKKIATRLLIRKAIQGKSYSRYDYPETLTPKHIQGEIVPKNNDSVFVVSIEKQEISAQIDALRDFLGEEKMTELQTQKEQRDGKDRYHITCFSPQEVRTLGKETLKQATRGININFTIYGIGTIKDKKGGAETFYALAESKELTALRKELGLPPKDAHITLAFKNKDVFSEPKTRQTTIID